MNSLEFIEKCIKETKRSIEHWKEQLKRYPEEEVLTRCLNTREIELQAFQEVKTQLEAWEVVKRYTDTSEDIVNTEYYFIKGMDSEFEILKKALEVEDE